MRKESQGWLLGGTVCSEKPKLKLHWLPRLKKANAFVHLKASAELAA